jgi:hypothetical protein
MTSFKNYLVESKKITKSDFMSLHKKGELGVVQGMVSLKADEVFKTINNTNKDKIDFIHRNLKPTTRASIDNDGEITKTTVFHENIHGKDFFVVETKVDNSKQKDVSWDTIEFFCTVYMKK